MKYRAKGLWAVLLLTGSEQFLETDFDFSDSVALQINRYWQTGNMTGCGFKMNGQGAGAFSQAEKTDVEFVDFFQ